MEIKETLMNRSFSVSSSDPYMFSLRIMEEISKNTKLIEKTNVYETDGPHNRSTVVFEALELIDDFSRISFRFELLGEDGLLRANVRGGLKLRIDETGFFSQVFSDYYVRTIFPILQKISEDRIKFFGEKIDKLINE